MKKFLKIAGIVVIVLIVVLIAAFAVTETGVLDTRFWKTDDTVYKPFYSGTYICGVDIMPGAYEIEFKGGISGYGWYNLYADEADKDQHKTVSSIPITQGEKGFRFTIEMNQVAEFRLDSSREMRYKKVD